MQDIKADERFARRVERTYVLADVVVYVALCVWFVIFLIVLSVFWVRLGWYVGEATWGESEIVWWRFGPAVGAFTGIPFSVGRLRKVVVKVLTHFTGRPPPGDHPG